MNTLEAQAPIVLPPDFHPIRPSPNWDWTDEQKLVHSHMAVSRQSVPVMVNSLAGTGKTSSTLHGVNFYMPWAKSVLLTAFGREAADQMQPKIRHPGAIARNFHRIGYAALAKMMPTGSNGKPLPLDLNSKASKWKIHNLADAWLAQMGTSIDEEEQANAKDTFVDLMTMIRLNLIDPTDGAALMATCATYGLRARQDIFSAMPAAIAASDKLALDNAIIDFTDMIYLPVKYNAQLEQYDAVIVDECLPYKTPVQLADGISMQIGAIVESRLNVEVLAYDTVTGTQKACKVIGWHKILNQKPLVKVSVRQTKDSHRKLGVASHFVVCTTDHKLWVNGQWIMAGDIKPGMTAQIETAAIKSQAYKTTAAGRDVLADAMIEKNKTLDRTSTSAGHITVRGGNGSGMTLAQETLLEALGAGWVSEHIVNTNGGRAQGLPTHFKLDIANPKKKVAVEVDGGSHKVPARQAADRRKTRFLQQRGWKVLHVTNREAVQQTCQCVAMITGKQAVDCPMDAIVVSVEPVSIPDNYVYDITVENCHDFYANGILVHNCQDLNVVTMEMTLRSVKPGGFFMAIGDPNQSIMLFAGSVSNGWGLIRQKITDYTHNAPRELRLTICQRCPVAPLEMVNSIYPNIGIRPREKAPQGSVTPISAQFFSDLARPGDAIASRFNRPLVDVYFDILRKGKIPYFKGMGDGLAKRMEKIFAEVTSQERFTMEDADLFVEQFMQRKVAQMEAKKADPYKIGDFEEACQCLMAVIEGSQARSEMDIYRVIKVMAERKPGPETILLTSIHRFKGGEAPWVFMLDMVGSLPFPGRGGEQNEEQAQQERNIHYVAMTRPMDRLFINDPSKNAVPDDLLPFMPKVATPVAAPAPKPEPLLTTPEIRAARKAAQTSLRWKSDKAAIDAGLDKSPLVGGTTVPAQPKKPSKADILAQMELMQQQMQALQASLLETDEDDE